VSYVGERTDIGNEDIHLNPKTLQNEWRGMTKHVLNTLYDMTEIIIISDDKNKVRLFPAFIRRLFLKEYISQGLIQMDKKTKELTICGDVVRWLDKLSVETTSSKRADRLMFEYLHEKYPQYKNYIQIF
jgi:hypothetical protein